MEVGCGPATDGKYLNKLGANVLSTDYSETMLSIAKELNPQGHFMKMDMQDLHFKDNSFDGFWATACLLHLEDPDKAIRELVRVTKKGGVGFISIKEGDGKEVDPRTGYFFRYYHHPEFVRKLSRLGVQTIRSGRKAGSPNHDWLTYLVRVIK
ncbi:MAG: class I SAM-dependent methyltransferase [Candidatus Woesebacteria bacterium]|nr:class I SAM-dependent methyltransferase [Candidatus Woesebacteria bacterium]